MAEGERRMLFDIRGRRKHVVRVVYAILALLMGASLFLVVGPVNIGGLINTSSSTEASKVLDEQAERVEAKLRRDEDNPNLMLAVVRARIGAGNAETELNPQTGTPVVNAEAQQDFEQAAGIWNAYLDETRTPNPSVALLMANTFFTLAQSGTTLEGISRNLDGAATAQRFVVDKRPSVGALTSLAIYEYFVGDFAAGDKAAKEAEAKATEGEAKQVEEQLDEYRQSGKQWQNQKKTAAKAEKERGEEALKNPLGGLGGTSGLGE